MWCSLEVENIAQTWSVVYWEHYEAQYKKNDVTHESDVYSFPSCAHNLAKLPSYEEYRPSYKLKVMINILGRSSALDLLFGYKLLLLLQFGLSSFASRNSYTAKCHRTKKLCIIAKLIDRFYRKKREITGLQRPLYHESVLNSI